MHRRLPGPAHLRLPAGALLATVLALLTAGCDTGDHPGNETMMTDGGSAAEHTVLVRPESPTSPAAPDTAALDNTSLEPGTFDIRQHEGGITILANQAPAMDVLEALAVLAGFKAQDTGASPAQVTLSIESADLHAALVELLRPGPYRIIYEFDQARGTDRLSRVVVGLADAPPQTVSTPPPLPGTGSVAHDPGSLPLPGTGQQLLSPEDQVYLTQLLDPSPEVRADAAESIEATGIALDYLARILTTDPSPEVRMAATYSLENSDDPRAVDTLIMGLNDSDPEVLVEVIDSLDFLDDRRVVPYLQPLLDHPDEDVRDAAEAAIESLQ